MYKNILIIILIGLNIFLVYSNITKQNEIRSMIVKESQTEISSTYKKALFLLETEDTLSLSTNIALLIFITDRSCIACIKTEINFINKIWDNFSDQMSIIYVGSEQSDVLKQFDINFDYKIIKSYKNFFNREINIENPTSFLVLNKKTVFDVHIAEQGSSKKSELFFNRMEVFLKAYNQIEE